MVREVLERSDAAGYQITDSHSFCYDFVKEAVGELSFLNPSGINLVNIDFHHDLYTVEDNKEEHKKLNEVWHGNSEVNAGNWL